MDFNELKKLSSKCGFDLVLGLANNYVLIPQNKLLLWATFDTLPSLEKALKKFVKEEKRKNQRKPTLYAKN